MSAVMPTLQGAMPWLMPAAATWLAPVALVAGVQHILASLPQLLEGGHDHLLHLGHLHAFFPN